MRIFGFLLILGIAGGLYAWWSSGRPAQLHPDDPRMATGDKDIVMLVADWCGYCRKQQGDFERAGGAGQYQGAGGVREWRMAGHADMISAGWGRQGMPRTVGRLVAGWAGLSAPSAGAGPPRRDHGRRRARALPAVRRCC